VFGPHRAHESFLYVRINTNESQDSLVPIVPNLIERQLLRLQPQLRPFLDLWGAGSFEVVRLASNLGIFEALRNGPKSSSAIAKEIKVDARGIRILLEALVPLGYVKEKNGYSERAKSPYWQFSTYYCWGRSIFRIITSADGTQPLISKAKRNDQ